MRCSFDRLAQLAKSITGQDPLSGHLFIFRSKGGDRLKILYWDKDGYALWYKRLEQGVFKLPRLDVDAKSVEPRMSELAMLNVIFRKFTLILARSTLIVGKFTLIVGKFTLILGKITLILGKITLVLGNSSPIVGKISPIPAESEEGTPQGGPLSPLLSNIVLDELDKELEKYGHWAYVVGAGDSDHAYNVFDFTLGRSRDGPCQFLRGFTGTLMADAYGGYNGVGGVVVGNELTRAGCWAHARRKFIDAESTHPAIAAEAVASIKQLYAIEERGKSLSVQERCDLRRRESVPILATLKDKLFTWRDQLLPKHPMALAVGYALNQWNELNVFAGDSQHAALVPIDNNISEREMKRIVLNRKNSLFVGNQRGGETAAILSSFTSTCRRCDIDPQRYFTQLLANLPATPLSQLDSWLPDQWKLRNSSSQG